MAVKLYPERMRCQKCSKKLETTVLAGLYCSYKCGGFPEPFKKVEDAPRGCRLERDGKWIWKQKYRAEIEVPQKLQNDPATNIYRCSHCQFLHVGHDRALGTEKARLIKDAETLGTVLTRIREEKNLTRKQVGDRLKVRPIRIKEIEENNETINTEVLFKLVKFYKAKIQILF